MPPATAQNRPFYINLDPNAAGRLFEYRPALVNGVLQWVLQPVYHLKALIQRLIRRIRAATWYNQGGWWVLNIHGGPVAAGHVPYSVNLTQDEQWP